MSPIRVKVDGGVAVLTLHRPGKHNAFTRDMGIALGEHYRAFDADDSIRAIVLTGTAPAFCAGADLGGGASTFDSPDAPEFSASPVFPPAYELRKPVIAAVNGHAIGIGLTLALQADIRIVADEGAYSVPQVRLGVIPDAASHWTLPRIAGMAAAAEIMLTGRRFRGPEAIRLGIASQSLPAAEVLPAALEMARDIATNVAPMSAALCKRLLWEGVSGGLDAAQTAQLETDLHHRVMGTADAAEGVRAMLERRTPRWSARVSEEWKPIR
ncbi:enoyl-CoA hydratase-related protein [Nocardia sp. NPDC051030]|uniref:enoyl-CoA hydratase/isomerase family protein n=1 Tax=Nocardia sp. NPDC051030 TaxID=3155162 RepID=UPI0034443F3B